MPSVLKPASTRWMCQKLLMRSVAPITSITASAHSATTSAERTRVRSPPTEAPWPPSLFRVPCRSTRRAWRAGTIPNSRPAAIATASATPSTRRSTAASATRGISAGASATRTTDAEHREPRAEDRRRRREEQSLGGELPREPPAVRAERPPHGHLAPPRRPAGEQQVRDVRAGDEEDEADGGQQHQQRGPDRTEDDRRQRLDEDPPRRVVGIRALEVGGNRGELLLCRAGTRSEPRHHEDRMRRARERLRCLLERQPHVDGGTRAAIRERAPVVGGGENLEDPEVRAALHDPDHRGRAIVDPDRLTDDRRIAAERARPEPVADHDDRRPALRRLLGREPASRNRVHAEHREQIVRHLERLKPGRLAAIRRVVHLAAHEEGDLLRALAALLVVEEVRERGRLARRARVAIRFPEDGEPIDVANRRAPQEHGVDHAEDGGVGADAERQRQKRHDRETGIGGQQPQRVAEILPEHDVTPWRETCLRAVLAF